MQEIHLTSIIWQEGNHFVAQCLQVDVSSFGETKDEALKNLDEALSLYFEDHKTEDIIPVKNPEFAEMLVKYA